MKLGGDSFAHILIYFLKLRQLVCAQNSKQWRYFTIVGTILGVQGVLRYIIDITEHPLIKYW